MRSEEHTSELQSLDIIAGLCNVEKVADGDAEGFGSEAQRGGARGAAVAINTRDALAQKDGARDAAAVAIAERAAQAQETKIASNPTTPAENA